jgi:DNA-directed RNA polymerase specialized sigma24 family protein
MPELPTTSGTLLRRGHGRRAEGPPRGEGAVARLVARVRSGDRAAWDEIVERYAPLVAGVCRAHGLRGEDAADVAAGVWLGLVESIDTLPHPESLPGWLTATARRHCLRRVAGRPRAVTGAGGALTGGGGAEPDGPLAAVALAKAAFAVHDLDALLARVRFDSALCGPGAPGDPRRVTFVAGRVAIDLEVTAGRPGVVRGRLSPAGRCAVLAVGSDGVAVRAEVDELGRFAVRPAPPGPVRLHVVPEAGPAVVTEPVALTP